METAKKSHSLPAWTGFNIKLRQEDVPFHTICSFLAAIGKRFGDTGLGDVVTESEIVGSDSVAAVLEGHHYNRALRTHKVSSLEVGDYSKRRRTSLSKSR